MLKKKLTVSIAGSALIVVMSIMAMNGSTSVEDTIDDTIIWKQGSDMLDSSANSFDANPPLMSLESFGNPIHGSETAPQIAKVGSKSMISSGPTMIVKDLYDEYTFFYTSNGLVDTSMKINDFASEGGVIVTFSKLSPNIDVAGHIRSIESATGTTDYTYTIQDNPAYGVESNPSENLLGQVRIFVEDTQMRIDVMGYQTQKDLIAIANELVL